MLSALMSRRKKLNILVPLVVILFLGAYARHRYINTQITVSGRLQDKQMDEISGIVASSVNKDVYYVHNDSGDSSRFFVISPEGKLYNTINYNANVLDCEDIAVGPGPVKGKSYVYIGDIGDNYSSKKCITIYRMPDNAALLKSSTKKINAVALHLKYPDGPRDAETLMIDPLEKLFYVVSKRGDSVAVYTAPLVYNNLNDTLVMTKRCKLFFDGVKPFKWITSGDISKDGQKVLVKSYEKVYYWQRHDNEPIWQTMLKAPRQLHYETEKQGEAIGFTPDGKGYYTTSEGVFSPIYYYKTP
jgi:hypothetical protein